MKLGEKACPFNYLYWNFLLENERKLARNPRLAMPYRTLDRMDAERKRAIRADATRFLEGLGLGRRVQELPDTPTASS